MSWDFPPGRLVSKLTITPQYAILTLKLLSVGFPALEKLTLDFSEWQLTDSEGLLVIMFCRRLDLVLC